LLEVFGIDRPPDASLVTGSVCRPALRSRHFDGATTRRNSFPSRFPTTSLRVRRRTDRRRAHSERHTRPAPITPISPIAPIAPPIRRGERRLGLSARVCMFGLGPEMESWIREAQGVGNF